MFKSSEMAPGVALAFAETGTVPRVARQLGTGHVVINGAAQNLATPFGGWGQSGFGRENGRFGIEECLQYRSLHGLVG
ncbi:aldehyde dehydrogenase family protein [Pseudorhodoferax soli]|nr:aldehyde dehydrogenase family protein [Pseudorhodoferax soli]